MGEQIRKARMELGCSPGRTCWKNIYASANAFRYWEWQVWTKSGYIGFSDLPPEETIIIFLPPTFVL